MATLPTLGLFEMGFHNIAQAGLSWPLSGEISSGCHRARLVCILKVACLCQLSQGTCVLVVQL